MSTDLDQLLDELTAAIPPGYRDRALSLIAEVASRASDLSADLAARRAAWVELKHARADLLDVGRAKFREEQAGGCGEMGGRPPSDEYRRLCAEMRAVGERVRAAEAALDADLSGDACRVARALAAILAWRAAKGALSRDLAGPQALACRCGLPASPCDYHDALHEAVKLAEEELRAVPLP